MSDDLDPAAELALGLEHLEAGRYQEALEALEGARCGHAGDADFVAECDRGVGIALFYLGRHEEALEPLRRAGKWYSQTGRNEWTAECEGLLGGALADLGRFEEALEPLLQAHRWYLQANQAWGVAECDRLIGGAYFRLDRFDEAVAPLQRAGEWYLHAGDEEVAAQCDMRLGQALLSLVRHEEALEPLTRAGKWYSQSGQNEWTAECEGLLGSALADLGRFEEALEPLLKARQKYLQANRDRGVAEYDRLIGFAYFRLDRFDEAVALLQRAGEWYLRAGDEEVAATCDVWLGDALGRLGRHEEALEPLRRARKWYLQANRDWGVAQCDRLIGFAYFRLDRFDEAVALLQRAGEWYLRAGDDAVAAECDVWLGDALKSSFRLEEALEPLQRARRWYSQTRQNDRTAECERVLGSALANLGRHEEALEPLLQAHQWHLQAGIDWAWAVADCDRHFGLVLVNVGRDGEALTFLRRAQQWYSDAGDDSVAADCDRLIGVALHRMGRFEEAVEQLRRARSRYQPSIGDWSAADCDRRLGAGLVSVGRLREALEPLRRARQWYLEANRERELTRVEGQNLADCERLLGTVEVGLNRWEEQVGGRLRGVFRSAGLADFPGREMPLVPDSWGQLLDGDFEAQEWLVAAEVCRAFGDHQGALHLVNAAKGECVKRSLSEPASFDYLRGVTLLALGHYDRAAVALRGAAKIFAVEGSPGGQTDACSAALASSLVVGSGLEVARDAAAMADCLAATGRMWEALAAFDQACDGFAAVDGAELEAAACRLKGAGLLVWLDRHEEALRIVAEVEVIVGSAAGGDVERADCDRLAATALTALGQTDHALQLAKRALVTLIEAGGDRGVKGDGGVKECRLLIAELYLVGGEHAEALMELEAAGDPSRDDRSRAAARHFLAVGVALGRLGRWDVARDALWEARARFNEGGAMVLGVARCDETLAEISEAQAAGVTGRRMLGHLEIALRYAIAAVAAFDAYRYRLDRSGLRASWSRSAHAASYARALSLAERHHKYALVAELIESARVQGLPLKKGDTPGGHAVRLVGHVEPPTNSSPDSSPEGLSLAGALAQAGEPVPLGPPAAVSVGHRSVLGGAATAVAEGSMPILARVEARLGRHWVALEAAAAAIGGPQWVWWGSWVAGDHLYWSVLSHDGMVEAGATPMAEVVPVLDRLGAALPQRRGGETPLEALARANNGAMTNNGSPRPPEAEPALARDLGAVLIPAPLRQRLEAATGAPLSLVVAPAPELGRVPFGLLGVADDGDLRVGERAVVRVGVSVALVAALVDRERRFDRSGGPVGPDATVLQVVDGGGERVRWAPLADWAETVLWGQSVLTRDDNVDALNALGVKAALATSEELAEALAARPDILAYLGHAAPGSDQAPASAHLVLADGNRLAARDWLYRPDRWPAPPRVALIACGSMGAEVAEWLGLAPAALWAGARVVAATSWDLPANLATLIMARTVVQRALRDAQEPAVAWREEFVQNLVRWRAGEGTSPLTWGAVQFVGLAG